MTQDSIDHESSNIHIEQARRVFWAGMREARKLTPREQAEAAHYAGGPSVDALEVLIRVYRDRTRARL